MLAGRFKGVFVAIILFISGFVVQAQEPGLPVINFMTDDLGGDVQLTWEPQSGSHTLIVVREKQNPYTFVPQDGVYYSADNNYTFGEEVEGPAIVVVDVETDNSAIITGLIPGIEYEFVAYAYNDNGGNPDYLIDPTFATVNVFTSAAPDLFEYTLSPDNSYVDITFDQSVFNNLTNPVTTADFLLTFNLNGAPGNSASIDKITDIYDNPLSGGEYIIRLHLIYANPIDGRESIDLELISNEVGNAHGVFIGANFLFADQLLNCVDPTETIANVQITDLNGGKFGITWDYVSGAVDVFIMAVENDVKSQDPSDGIRYNINTTFGVGDVIGNGHAMVYESTNYVELDFSGGSFYNLYLYPVSGTCYALTPVTAQVNNSSEVTFANGNALNTINSVDPGLLPVFEFDVIAPGTNGQFSTLNVYLDPISSITNLTSIFNSVQITRSGSGKTEVGNIETDRFNFTSLFQGGNSVGTINATTEHFIISATLNSNFVDRFIDWQTIVFRLDQSSIVDFSGGNLATAAVAYSSDNGNFNEIEVIATQLNLVQFIDGIYERGQIIGLFPVVEATDVKGAFDLDFNDQITLTTSPNLDPVYTDVFSDGLLDFSVNSDLSFNIAGTSDVILVAEPSNLSIGLGTVTIQDNIMPTILEVNFGVPVVNNDNLVQSISIVYDEVMDAGTAPAISFNGSTEFTSNGDGSWTSTYQDKDTYIETFTHSGNNDIITGESILISDGAFDPSGNNGETGSFGTFDINVVPCEQIVATITSYENTNCTASNGFFEISISSGVTSSYSVEVIGQGTGYTDFLTGFTGGATIPDLPADLYTIIITDDDSGCSTTFERDILDNPINSIFGSIASTPVTSCQLPNGTITISDGDILWNGIGQPAQDYSVAIYDAQFGLLGDLGPSGSDLTISGLDVGTYYLEAIGSVNDCPTSLTGITISDNTVSPTANAISIPNTGCTIDNGSIDLIPGGTAGPFTFEWSVGGNIIGNTEDLTGLAEGIYDYNVIDDATGCSVSGQVTVDLGSPSNPIINQDLVQNRTSCVTPNGSIAVTITGGSGDYSYAWTYGGSGYATQEDISGLDIGFYEITVTDNATGCFSVQGFTITDLTQEPIVNLSATPNSSCDTPNGFVLSNVSGGTGPYTYSWTSNGGFTSTDSEIYNLPADTYFLEVTDQPTGCSSSPVSVVINNSFTPITGVSFTGGTTICSNETATLSVTFQGGSGPFDLEIDNGVGVISNYVSGDPIIVSPSTNTTYNIVSLTDANSCQPDTYPAPVTVNVNQIPTNASNVLISSVNITETTAKIEWSNGSGSSRLVVVKEGAAVDAAPQNGVSYTGNSVFGTGTQIGNGNFVVYKGSVSSVTVTGLSPGTTYHVVVYDYNATCYASGTTDISFITDGCGSVPPIVNSNTLTEVICNGESTNLLLSSSTSGVTFNWTASGTDVTGFSDGTGTTITQTLTNSTAIPQIVTYTATATIGTCTGPETIIQVTVQPTPAAYAVTGSGSICPGQGSTAIIGLADSDVGVNYKLILAGSQVGSNVAGTGGPIEFPLVSLAGIYSVEASAVSGASGNCVNIMTGTYEVVEDPLPQLSGSISGNVSVCENESGITYSVTDPGNINDWNWTVPNGIVIVDGANTNSITVAVLSGASSGAISVFGSNSCGTSGTLSTNISVQPGFTANIITEPEIWAGRGALYSIETVENVTAVEWFFSDGNSSNGISPTYTFGDPGDYEIFAIVTNDQNCTANASTSVTVGELAKIIIKNVVTPNGDGSNDILFIENLEYYPNTQVKFLDRWGKELISIDDYQNDWDLTVNGEVIPSGSYICVAKLPDGDVYTMTVTVIK